MNNPSPSPAPLAAYREVPTDDDRTPKEDRYATARANLLFQMLMATAEQRNETPRELAASLGVSYGYLMVLSRGERPIQSLSHGALQNAAKYLNVPLVQVYVWANIVTPGDFYSARTVGDELDRLYEDFTHDHAINLFAPTRAEWDALPERSKLTIALMYETLRHRNYLTLLNVPKDFPSAD